MLFNRLLLVVLSLLLVACTSSEQQLAQSGDWWEIGYSDGVKGRLARSFGDLQALGQVNQADYEQGYVEGVGEYCNPNFAYQMGLSGFYYEGVCEGTEDAQLFRMEWQRGWNESN